MSGNQNTGSDIWGIVAGVVGVLTAVPFIWAFVQSQLPPAKLRHLLGTLKETEGLLQSVVEEGLLDLTENVPHFREHLSKFRSSADQLRDETFLANTFRQQICAWLDGLSERISVLCTRVEEVRVRICETSAEARAQRMPDDPIDNLAFHRGLRARFRRFLSRIASLLRLSSNPSSAVEVSAPGAGAHLPAHNECPASNSSADALCDGGAASADQCPDEYNESDRKAVPERASPAPIGVPKPRRSHIRALIHVIRQVDKDLTLQGRRHPLLAQIVQVASQKPGRPASKRVRGRLSRGKSHSPLFQPNAVEHTAVLPQACHPDEDTSDMSSWEDALCDKEDHTA